MRIIGPAAMLLLLLASPAAQAMDVATFLARAEAAQRKGPAAILSSEARGLLAEARGAMKAITAERLAATKAGRTPAYCPAAKAGLSQSELLAALKAVSPADRARTEVKDAVRAGLARKYPCAG